MAAHDKDSTILVMAGGTGGHVYPALSIARRLQGEGMRVAWLGTRAGLEARVIPAAGIPLHVIRIAGVRGTSLLRKLFAPTVISLAIVQSLVKMFRIKPACVLGMGGFATGPGGVAAWALGHPLVIHEQNAIAGFTNQLLFPLATTVLEGFPGAFERKRELSGNPLLRRLITPGAAVPVGNPVRADIVAIAPPEERLAGRAGALRILVIGGSRGAAVLNETVPGALAALTEETPEIRHQCGAGHLDTTREHYARHGIALDDRVRVEEFMDDMAAAYAWADLVICRAGAVTVSELACTGVASILVPFPHAVDDHQTANARVLADAGGAVIVQQSELSAGELARLITHFQRDRDELLACARAARSVAQPRAGELAAGKCLEACHA